MTRLRSASAWCAVATGWLTVNASANTDWCGVRAAWMLKTKSAGLSAISYLNSIANPSRIIGT